MIEVIIAFGSNLGNRRKNISRGLGLLAGKGVSIKKISGLRETAPVEGVTGGNFFNGALLAETALAPGRLLKVLHLVEAESGRSGSHRPGEARTLDLDIVYYGGRIINRPDLQVPHPKRLSRSFVLEPAAEIAPDFVDPVGKKKLKDLKLAQNADS